MADGGAGNSHGGVARAVPVYVGGATISVRWRSFEFFISSVLRPILLILSSLIVSEASYYLRVTNILPSLLHIYISVEIYKLQSFFNRENAAPLERRAPGLRHRA